MQLMSNLTAHKIGAFMKSLIDFRADISNTLQ